MAITLRPDEVVASEVNFHWLAFIASKLLALVGVIVLLAYIATISMKSLHSGMLASTNIYLPIVAIICFCPFCAKWLENKCKSYVVTSQRLYLEKGILSKSKKDIPIAKIDDVVLEQSLLKRMVGAGDIVILTGNDVALRISCIDKPNEFKDAISAMVARRPTDR